MPPRQPQPHPAWRNRALGAVDVRASSLNVPLLSGVHGSSFLEYERLVPNYSASQRERGLSKPLHKLDLKASHLPELPPAARGPYTARMQIRRPGNGHRLCPDTRGETTAALKRLLSSSRVIVEKPAHLMRRPICLVSSPQLCQWSLVSARHMASSPSENQLKSVN